VHCCHFTYNKYIFVAAIKIKLDYEKYELYT